MKYKTEAERNYGIDLLRIVTMFMVVILHSLGHGGVLSALTATGSIRYGAAWLLETGAYCAVNCYALTSGFVGLHSRYKISNLISLWLQVVFYHACFTLLGALWEHTPVTIDLIAKAFLPLSSNAYWYFTSYCAIFFFLPLVDTAIEHLEKRQLQLALSGILVLLCVYPTARGIDVFRLLNGYHALWLLILYALGAYLNKYPPLKHLPGRAWALTYLISVVLSWGVLLLNNHLKATFPDADLFLIDLIRYTSPTILLAAVSLLMLFSRLRTAVSFRHAVTTLSSLTFGVYLIHDSVFIREHLISGRLASLSGETTLIMLPKVVLFALAVYGACSLIEFIRTLLFRGLRVRTLLDRLEAKCSSIRQSEEPMERK